MTLYDKLIQNFIEEDRWMVLVNGLKITVTVTFFAVLIGLLLGFTIAIIRSTYETTNGTLTFSPTKRKLLSFGNTFAKLYLTVIRGTPVVVQLMIMYFVIFAASNNKLLAAILAFGLNSAAYVAEIMRSGIMSIDSGQYEAGRSLGFNYMQTTIYIILPQAIRNVLPALGNEIIVLLKETSVSPMIGLADLTYGGNLIRSRTYEAFLPLLAVAAIYLVMVIILSKLLGKLEGRLRKGAY